MGNSSKPRKPYRPRERLADPVSWAIAGAHTLLAAAREAMLMPITAAVALLKQGRAARDDWNVICQALNVAEALAGEQVGRNLMPQISEGLDALREIGLRLAAGRSSTCYAAEIHAIDEALFMYEAQLKVCTQADLSRAVKRVKQLHSSGAMDDVGRLYERMKQAA